MARRWSAQHLLDLGDGRARAKRIPPSPESELSAPLKQLLTYHAKVAWAARLNNAKGFLVDARTMQAIIEALGGGAAFTERFGRPRWLEFGTPGASDFIGQLRDGRVLAIETKPRPYTPCQVSQEQRSFLASVNRYGGLGLVADNLPRIDAVLSGREETESTGLGYRV